MPLKILHEDATLVVIDKPAGLTIEQIEKELGYTPASPAGGPAHRLDKDTSGVLLVAKTPEALEEFRKQFRERQVVKRYICLIEGNLKASTGTIHTLLARSLADRRKQRTFSLSEPKVGRREALTEWKVLKRFEDPSTNNAGYTLLEIIPKTGRKHQVRAHMASLGHPVAGDQLYGFKNQRIPRGLTRQFLHAAYLKIGNLECSSQLPPDLQTVLDNLTETNGYTH
ncbi:MAG TPA: hypothetical protein DIS53_02105 [Candidatus Wildermuthbacteria bacterium]|uniref:Pseudouridine synthase n=1 Tax=Candidatus Yanofskybacteria bacterium GW2011_GWC1_48_11 TaxID=1619027 RepID=A0A837IPM1_9BACT|nr:MAG: Pseudouridine synthase [Candidatus Yanofskybacteria bacterium GW2011_GWC1_48_11]KKW03873.1 MAG: Pseudouridine synthase [Parcubacteria group bacterium GW2011_GWB1_49_12]KKW08565.1 MAG: Pseudouridine synthase [Parcubacteria group bacterium GW2011_GWA1_49_26]KKW14043.1 MAG: Pseudouridine synthase [Parcubacteria group bacterium GW2011_GWA2_50_10]OHA61283.1 MAG: hypothetical protein A2109_03405 [Candidatus Wildermuthbacteria bacterium GWA1_49_26]OHA65439.1 MAG: hypothetical protein A2674_01